MVTLNKIYTRTGDAGSTRLASGEMVSKADARVQAYGGVDETNSAVGMVRLHTASDPVLDPILARIQNDLFDLGADLSTPVDPSAKAPALRIIAAQVVRLEAEIDQLNSTLSPLTSFVLPGGSAAAAALHMARTICRRAERGAVGLAAEHGEALKYLNRLSDLLFVAARFANSAGSGDVLWIPGASR